jgi:hypothetical protein
MYISFQSNNFWPCYGPWTLKCGQIFSRYHFFFAMLGDIDLNFGLWVYNDELQIKCTFRSGPMIFGWVMALGLWNLAKYLAVTTFFSLCLEILIWCLVYECIMMSYRSSLHFVPVQWFFWPSYGPWTLKFGQIFSCRYAWRYWFSVAHHYTLSYPKSSQYLKS